MIKGNNPLNIRRGKTLWKGEITPLPIEGECFCHFESVEWGLRAAFCLLRTYATKYRLNCVKDIITRWAPPKENDTTSYIRHVCLLTGFGGNQRLTEKDWPRLVKAMARMECGADLDNDVIQKAFQLYRQKL
jgi:hypothetical protein